MVFRGTADNAKTARWPRLLCLVPCAARGCRTYVERAAVRRNERWCCWPRSPRAWATRAHVPRLTPRFASAGALHSFYVAGGMPLRRPLQLRSRRPGAAIALGRPARRTRSAPAECASRCRLPPAALQRPVTYVRPVAPDSDPCSPQDRQAPMAAAAAMAVALGAHTAAVAAATPGRSRAIIHRRCKITTRHTRPRSLFARAAPWPSARSLPSRHMRLAAQPSWRSCTTRVQPYFRCVPNFFELRSAHLAWHHTPLFASFSRF